LKLFCIFTNATFFSMFSDSNFLSSYSFVSLKEPSFDYCGRGSFFLWEKISLRLINYFTFLARVSPDNIYHVYKLITKKTTTTKIFSKPFLQIIGILRPYLFKSSRGGHIHVLDLLSPI